MPVSSLETTFYADWRLQHGKSIFLHDESSPMPERLLQIIWHHQRLLRDQLKTLDGKSIRVLHPGFWNREAGPDFRGAVLQIGNEAPTTGDVEIDLCSDGWRQHGHDRNPNFANVILHVVWGADDVSEIPAPTVALKPYLDSPISELSMWLGSDSAKSFPTHSAGQCCAPLRDLSKEKLTELLQQAALVRLQRKASEFEARARQAGWEQALWEGIFRALGYKQNIWPMRRLGELLMTNPAQPNAAPNGSDPLCHLSRSAFSWQAWLLGMSGLLPTEPDESENGHYVCKIWEIWWRERNAWSDLVFPKKLWRFNGMRPANLPQRRLALASHWLADKNFFTGLEKWFLTPGREPDVSLLNLLQIKDDVFWSWHWNFRSACLPQPQPLIGSARITDIAVNVILPWFWIRAVTGKNEALQRHAEQLYFNWPPAENNSVLRLARQRLFGGREPVTLHTAATQQGLLQIVKDFCEHSNAICADCTFPDLVRGWNLQNNAG